MDSVSVSSFRFDVLWEYREMFLHAVVMTLKLSVIAIVLGTLIGLIVAFARMAKSDQSNVFVRFWLAVCRYASLAYVTFFRGTPLFVQIFLWYFVWFKIFVNPESGLIFSGQDAIDIRREYGPFIAGVLALSANAGAYMAEIFRGGIQSVSKGQIEASRSLGLSYWQSMRHVILPQAIRRMLPPFGNEFITLVKDSSLVSAISVAELLFTARTIAGNYSLYREPYYAIALIYLVLTVCLAFFFSWLEKKYKITVH